MFKDWNRKWEWSGIICVAENLTVTEIKKVLLKYKIKWIWTFSKFFE